MKNVSGKKLCTAIGFLVLFAVWTILVSKVNVAPIGPEKSSVGFSAINGFFHNLTGVNMTLYVITDWLGLVPVFAGFGFAVLGLCQWIRRKNILKVDLSILILGGFYIVVIVAYLLFEEVVINYRPILINGFLEASYPSSTTLLVLCVMPAAMIQFNVRIKNRTLRRCVSLLITFFIVFMVGGRLISGVHWLTDIVGGVLLSVGLTMLYISLTENVL